MAFCRVNDIGVISGELTFPIHGLGNGQLILNTGKSEITSGQDVEVVFESGDTFTFYCIDASPNLGKWRLSLLQGKNKLHTRLEPKFYQNAPWRIIVTDAMTEAGEAADVIDLAGNAEKYCRDRKSAFSSILDIVSRFEDKALRANEQGKLGIYSKESGDSFDAVVVAYYSDAKLQKIAPSPGLRQGGRLNGTLMDRFTHVVKPNELYTLVALL